MRLKDRPENWRTTDVEWLTEVLMGIDPVRPHRDSGVVQPDEDRLGHSSLRRLQQPALVEDSPAEIGDDGEVILGDRLGVDRSGEPAETCERVTQVLLG